MDTMANKGTTMDATTTEIATVGKLEREPCSRCGGSGKYSWCQMYGDRCFKCRGKGEVLTKRGAAAAAYLLDLRSKRADELKPGDVVRDQKMGIGAAGGVAMVPTWATVTAVEPYEDTSRGFINGVESPRRTDLLTVATTVCHHHGVAPEQKWEIKQSPAEQVRTLCAALVYQDTLTKQGKPRRK